MAVLVVAGMMGIIWVVAIASIVAVEKLSSRGAELARWIGVASLRVRYGPLYNYPHQYSR